MTDPLLDSLRAADPVARLDLSRVDEGVFAPISEGIPMTETLTRPHGSSRHTTPRKRGRRVAAGTLAAVLLGGAAATAVYQRWVGVEETHLVCLTAWADSSLAQDDASTGPALTTDAVADCQNYQRQAGLAEIADPVAVTFEGHQQIFVMPATQVPAGATRLGAAPASLDLEAVRELKSSMGDLVDGGESRCFDATSGPAFAQSELTRLELPNWKVQTEPGDTEHSAGQCGFFEVNAEKSTVVFYPDRFADPAGSEGPRGEVAELRDTLKREIAQRCLSVSAAREVAERAAGSAHHWPTSTIADGAADCARVDVEVAGSVQITIYGPEQAKG